LRLQVQRSKLVHCHDGKRFFCWPFVNIFLAARFLDGPVMMNRMHQ
jgi:hypothetical protein